MYQLSKLDALCLSITNSIIVENSKKNYFIKEIIIDYYSRINILNISDFIEIFKTVLDKILQKNRNLSFETVDQFTNLLIESYFSNFSQLKIHMDELMILKGLEGFIKEFNEEMTFRDFNKIKGNNHNELTGKINLY